MADCRQCGRGLQAGDAVCAQCGATVQRREQMSLGLGWFLGTVLTIVCWVAVAATSFGAVALGNPNACDPHWFARIFFLVLFLGCFAALFFGIRAGQRGYPARATLIMLPAIGVLIQAAVCTSSLLSIRC